MPSVNYFQQMATGYLLTVVIETTVLLLCLSPRHSTKVRLAAGVWLTTCTYPIVWLVLPPWMSGHPYAAYLLVAELFAALAEAMLFWYAFICREPQHSAATWRDLFTICLANLTSFAWGLRL